MAVDVAPNAGQMEAVPFCVIDRVLSWWRAYSRPSREATVNTTQDVCHARVGPTSCLQYDILAVGRHSEERQGTPGSTNRRVSTQGGLNTSHKTLLSDLRRPHWNGMRVDRPSMARFEPISSRIGSLPVAIYKWCPNRTVCGHRRVRTR